MNKGKLVRFTTSQGLNGGTVIGDTTEGKVLVNTLDGKQVAVSKEKVEVIPFQRGGEPSEAMKKRLAKEIEQANQVKEAVASNQKQERDLEIEALKLTIERQRKVIACYKDVIEYKSIDAADKDESVKALMVLVEQLI